MSEIYMARFRKVFATSDLNWGFLYFCLLVAQKAQTSAPACFIFGNFPTPSPTYSGPKSSTLEKERETR